MLIGSLVGFLVTVEPLHASADTVFRQMTAQEAYAFYGDTLDIVYYSSTGYKHATLNKSVNGYVYNRPSGDTEVNSFPDVPDWVKSTSLDWVVYGASISDYSLDPSYLGINITPNVHFTDCNALRFAAAGYLANTEVSSQAYDDSFIRVSGLTDLRFSNSPYAVNNVFPHWRIDRGNGSFRIAPVWCDYTSDTLTNVNLLQIGLNGCRLDNTRLNVYLSCPLVNDTAYGATGTVVSTSTPTTQTGVNGDINVNVDVDMEETNGLLDSILDGISGLVDGIADIFIPEDGILESFENDLAELLQDTFGGVESDMLINVIEDLLTHGATESVTFPAINVPGTNFHINSYSVPLKPASTQLHSFYDAVALALDLVATIAVLNQIFDKMKAVVVGEKVVELENVD